MKIIKKNNLTMKKLILGLCFFCFGTISLFAQPGDRANAKIEAQKVAYITNRLDLTTDEASKFWPIYNQFQKDKRAINKKYKNKQRLENMSDSDLEEHMLSTFKKDQDLLDLKKGYFEKLKTVFQIRKIAMLQRAEREFKTTILDMMRERKKARKQKRREMQRNN